MWRARSEGHGTLLELILCRVGPPVRAHGSLSCLGACCLWGALRAGGWASTSCERGHPMPSPGAHWALGPHLHWPCPRSLGAGEGAVLSPLNVFIFYMRFYLPLLLLLSHFSRANSVRPHRRQPTRLPRPWDSPGKNTGVGCHFLLQCMTVKSQSEVAQSCLTLSDPMDCSLPGSSVHGIFQARVLEWGAIAFSATFA